MRSAMLLFALLASGCATIPPTPVEAPPQAAAGVAFDRSGERGSYAEGLADPAARRPVTVDDPVRIASVSKLVVAIAVMKLVEEGKLDLDADAARWFGPALRNPAFPQRPITLRMLLSHTSSLRDGDDVYVVPLGQSLAGVLGQEAAWDQRRPPGAGYFTYANLNFPVIASIIEQVTQERFDGWIRREVIEPMKLDACFNWPTCSDAAVKRAVVLTQNGEAVRDDLKGVRPLCPVVPAIDGGCDLTSWRPGVNGALFSPQGGLRISMRDLARVGRMLLNSGTLDGARILSPQAVEALLTQVWTFDGSNGDTDEGFYCSYGLATQQIPTPRPGCSDDPNGDGIARVGHAGDAYGLRSGLWIDRLAGTGVAYFVAGLAEDPLRGRSAFRAAEEAAFRRTLVLAAAASLLVDPRDSETYRLVALGGLRWMAENLRYVAPGSTCDALDADNCRTLGRLYDHDEALRACPPGWRLPSDADWMALEQAVGVPVTELRNERSRGAGSGDRLKSGGDSGFNALFAGYSDPHRDFAFRRRGETAAFWTSTLDGSDDVSALAWHRDVAANRTGIYRSKVNVTYRLSVRCVTE